jgi:hypothetical protein
MNVWTLVAVFVGEKTPQRKIEELGKGPIAKANMAVAAKKAGRKENSFSP